MLGLRIRLIVKSHLKSSYDSETLSHCWHAFIVKFFLSIAITIYCSLILELLHCCSLMINNDVYMTESASALVVTGG